ncbi:TonB-dependent receptor [Sphingobacterium sp. LRF_L2]|uniref:TonB-dependent receptor n=1 Tax=Sphingobacterium sp. LRF_L2 TaxID=3369421 RepID=UPI003F5E44C9
MYKKYILYLFFLLAAVPVLAQTVAVNGTVRIQGTRDPYAQAKVYFERSHITVFTDERGNFSTAEITSGEETVSISGENIQLKRLAIFVPASGVLALGEIAVQPNIDIENPQPLMMAADDMLDDDNESAGQNISAKVILSNDVYLNKVAFQLSPFRFRVRGYQNIYEQKYINGVHFNDQLRGVFNFASIGAINDLTRNGDDDNYMTASTFAFGSIGGTENINMRASTYAKGFKATGTYTNRNYYSRGMLSYSTGLQDNGWAFTALIGGRYADKGNVEGTFYENFSYAFSVEKQFKQGQHSLSFVTFGSPVRRGQQSASFQEVYDLLDNNLYNPNWGYQNGEVRNSRVVTAYDPTAILSHIWKIDANTRLTTGVSLHYGKYANTALNWYDGPDPRPDYYRYLPSYQTEQTTKDYYTNLWTSNKTSFTQINWDNMYLANKLEEKLNDGAAIYMLEKRHSDLLESGFNSTLNKTINEHAKLTAGIAAKGTQSQQYKTVDDLLGASYVLDIDKFSERDFAGNNQVSQNDLLNPNAKAYKGDIFGYRFNINIRSANAWIQNEYSYDKVDFYYGTQLSYTQFDRVGYMKNGRNPNNSYGKGQSHEFLDYGVKGGLTYKINGRHMFTGNINYMTKAPLVNDAYISPRINDRTTDDLESSKIFSTDLSYIFSMPRLNGRLSVFQTNFNDLIDRFSYYHDSQRTFVNHALRDISQVNRGVELGLSYKIDNNWTLDLAATKAEYYYKNNPMGILNSENGQINNEMETVYLKNSYVGGMPQTVGTFGVRYFYDYWFLGANINYSGDYYIDQAPLRRLASNYITVNPADIELFDAYKSLTTQEKYDNYYTVDLSIGKIIYLKNRNSINVNIAVNNLLNDTNIRTGGYEQGRLDLSYPNKFLSKYYYMQGTNCFINVNYKFK